MAIFDWIVQLLWRSRNGRDNGVKVANRTGQASVGSSIPKSSAEPFHIAVIGAGIGGLALALGLVNAGVSFTLYESAAEYSTVGAGIGLGPNALRAMDHIDKRFRAMYNDISSGNLTPNKEHVMFHAAYAERDFGKRRGWTPQPFGAGCYNRTSAHRRDLLNIMTSLIPIERVRFKKRVKAIEQLKDKVRITFEDGEVVVADAVIGCDGAKGPTRAAVLGSKYPNKVAPTYSGKYVYRSVIPMKEALDVLGPCAGDAMAFLGPKVNFIAFPISNGTQCNLVAFKFDDKPWTHPEWTKKVTKEKMVNDFGDDVDERIIKLLDWATPLQWSLWHHIDTPTYYNGRICLLGDSAHATTPHQASGAGQCLEDALILSHVLGKVKKSSDLVAAFQVYDAIRRPRAQEVVRTSQEAGQMYSFTHPEFGSDMEKIVKNFNQRYLWIWERDLAGDMKAAETQLRALVKQAS